MPIEDPFLEAQTSDLGVPAHQPLPFSQTDNPVMSTLAFLAATVSPAVAAAASKAALSEFLKGTEHATPADQPDKSVETGGRSDMEVDSGNQALQGDLRAHLEKTTAAALAAAATKAYVLARSEERKLQKLVIEAVETQVKKLELKLAHFEELETLLGNERKAVEKQRVQLFQERLALRKAFVQGDGLPAQMNVIPNSQFPGSQAGGASSTGDRDPVMKSL